MSRDLEKAILRTKKEQLAKEEKEQADSEADARKAEERVRAAAAFKNQQLESGDSQASDYFGPNTQMREYQSQ